MDITLTNINDGSAISLLTNVIKEQQELLVGETSKRQSAERERDDFRARLEKVSENHASALNTIKEHEGTIVTLRESNLGLTKGIETKREEAEALNNELNKCRIARDNNHQLLETAKNQIIKEQTYNESLRKDIEKIQGERDQLAQEKSILEDSKTSLENTIKSLQGEVSSMTMKYYLEKSNSLRLVLQAVEKILRDGSFVDFLKCIINGIEDFGNQTQSIDDFKFKIKAKDNWLAKLASLYWWSREESVKGYIPIEIGESSVFMEAFLGYLDFLSTIDLKVDLPSENFNGEIPSYKPDYDGEISCFKQLFPEYATTKFILCEISGLAFNGNPGKCKGLNP